MAPPPKDNPITPTPSSPRGPALLRGSGRGRGQGSSMIPSPAYHRSTRQLSAGFVAGGPLSSHPTTAYSSLVAAGSRGSFDRAAPARLTGSQTTSNLPDVPLRKQKRRSLVPVPSTPTTTTPGEKSALTRFLAENVPPGDSLAGLAGKHRDSMEIRSTYAVPRRGSPYPEGSLKVNHPFQVQRAQRVRSPPPFELLKDEEEEEDESLQLRRVRRVPSPVPLDLKQKGPAQQLSTQIPQPTPDKKAAGMSKSRTFNALTNLTSSLSLSSLSNFGRHESRRPAASNMADQTTSTPTGSSTSFGLMSAQPTTPTPASPARGYHYTDPRLVHTAQPWAYWSGRYMSLRDKFLNEILEPSNLSTVLTADSERNKLAAAAAAAKAKASTSSNTGLTASSTTSHLPARPSALDPTPAMITAANLTDDDMRDLRIFMHLEGVCTTDDARDSLYDFQAAYARRQKKEWLLPRGGAMDPKGKGKGWVGRMFSGGKDGGKKSGGSGSR